MRIPGPESWIQNSVVQKDNNVNICELTVLGHRFNESKQNISTENSAEVG